MAEPTAEIILFQAAARGAVIDTMEGFEPTADEGSPVDAWLARAVRSEVMSVRSFQGIARDLQALGAPAPHVRRARPAARDEVAHARLLSGLAHARGSQIVPVCALPARGVRRPSFAQRSPGSPLTKRRLRPAERRAVLQARARALEALVASQGRAVPTSLVRELGLPDVADATRLARALAAAMEVGSLEGGSA